MSPTSNYLKQALYSRTGSLFERSTAFSAEALTIGVDRKTGVAVMARNARRTGRKNFVCNRVNSGILACCLGVAIFASQAMAVSLVRLSPENWDNLAPKGKEVDAIYGDFVLRNDRLVAVIGNPICGRNGNMTLRNVGGVIIDLTLRDAPNDQLSAFYPVSGNYPQPEDHELKLVRIVADGEVAYEAADHADEPPPEDLDLTSLQKVSLLFAAVFPRAGQPKVHVEYSLSEGDPFVRVETSYSNPHDKTITLILRDTLRVDGEFEFGFENDDLCWACDPWWGQAYGVLVEGASISLDPICLRHDGYLRMFGPALQYEAKSHANNELAPNESFSLVRRIFPARDSLAVKAIAAQLAGQPLEPTSFKVSDQSGPVANASVEVFAEVSDDNHGHSRGDLYGSGRASAEGILAAELPPGSYQLRVTPPGREAHLSSFDVPAVNEIAVGLPNPAYVVATITDESGDSIPCKVGFYGQGETPDPCFGPDSGIHGVRNLYYSHNGQFQLEIAPGRYQVVVSHGPEYDAIVRELNARPGEQWQLHATLVRSVDTTGWISADLHSHSSPSGDTTASQRGRVLNNLAENLEFCPCTEHNLVSSYASHLAHFDANHLMLTCPGIELTGSPLTVNHQNAFPMVLCPHTQNGGGPTADVDPVKQIKRLSEWDDNSDKLVQINHPNIVQILADRDLDGKYDSGFSEMLKYADVMEVHPLEDIFHPPESLPSNGRGRSKAIFHWLQILNLGYRIPGVVNTDAHLNFQKMYDLALLDKATSDDFDWNLHGAGSLRNYIKSSTDDLAKANVLELCHAAKRGAVVMSNGPFVEVRASSATNDNGNSVEVGSELAAPSGKVRLYVRVQCANWIQVNRVQLFLNGRAAENFNYTRRTHPQYFYNRSVVFDAELELSLEIDTNIVVVAAGEGEELGIVMGPDAGKAMPIAVTNPIFVDGDGDGFTPNGDMLGLPLPAAANEVSQRQALD
jgi:hypothetical protein